MPWRGLRTHALAAPLLTRANGDVVTLDQRFQTGDTRQGNRWFDHPELRALDQIILGQRVQRKLGRCTGQVVCHCQGFERAHLDALVHDRCTARLQALVIAQFHLYPDAGLGRIEVLIQTERQVRVGGRAVLAVFRRGKGDTTGNNARQRFATHFHARGEASMLTPLAFQKRVCLRTRLA